MRKIDGFCYYSNHYDQLIRDGCFLPGSGCLNGEGTLINYKNDNILIPIGVFKEDVHTGIYITIISKPPFYETNGTTNA